MSSKPSAARVVLRAVLAAGALGAALLAPAAQAQESNAAFWLQERERQIHARPQPRQPVQVRRLVPNKRLAKPTNWRAPDARPGLDPSAPGLSPFATPDWLADAPPAPPAVATPPAQTADSAPAVKPEPAAPAAIAPPAPSATVAVIGDNLGFMLAQGLADAQAEGATGGVGFVRKTRDSSGLVRDDFYDWRKTVRDILAGPEKYAAVAIMIGSNDRQELRDAAGRHEPLTPAWREIYTARIADFLAPLKEKGVPFFWVGLPVMKSDRYSADMAQLNEIYRAQAEAAGGKFVDVWDAFGDENGRYNAFGPNLNGEIVKLRTTDGVHFTKAGARKLAWFAEQGMRAVLEPPKPAEPAVAALPPALRDQKLVPDAPPAVEPPKVDAPAAAAPPPKPAAGPILPLTAPPVAPGGQLAGPLDAPRLDRQARALPPQDAAPRRGRADDFAWPRR